MTDEPAPSLTAVLDQLGAHAAAESEIPVGIYHRARTCGAPRTLATILAVVWWWWHRASVEYPPEQGDVE